MDWTQEGVQQRGCMVHTTCFRFFFFAFVFAEFVPTPARPLPPPPLMRAGVSYERWRRQVDRRGCGQAPWQPSPVTPCASRIIHGWDRPRWALEMALGTTECGKATGRCFVPCSALSFRRRDRSFFLFFFSHFFFFFFVVVVIIVVYILRENKVKVRGVVSEIVRGGTSTCSLSSLSWRFLER